MGKAADTPRGLQTAVAVIGEITPSKVPEYIDPRDWAANPNGLVGRYVFLQGQALTVTQRDTYTWFQLMAQPRERTTTESVSVMLFQTHQVVRRDECYRVAGITAGTDATTLALTGVRRDVPLLLALAVVPAPAGRSGFGCASP